MVLRILIFLFLFLSNVLAAQDFSALAIPGALKENANAVVRLEKRDVVISSRKSMLIKEKRIVTVLNEQGLGASRLYARYDKATRIKSIEAAIYDVSGKEIKKIKKKDFNDHSLSEGFDITDTRILYNGYEPQYYPCTIEFTVETETSNTAWIPSWSPVNDYLISVEKSEYSIACPVEMGLKYKELNFSSQPFTKQDNAGIITYTTENIPAKKSESYSPSVDKIWPHVLFGVDKFNLYGVEGDATNWAAFGSWMYNNLIAGTDELLPATVDKIKSITAVENDPLKKAKLVYEYVQGKTRYISIQLGIGGWKPMLAKDVDRLGYGDCKALTNYTRALLKAVGVESYFTVVYGDRGQRSLREDFVSLQGNHVILAIPAQNGYVWLECTSQDSPFGFQGDFTDNRMVLIVKPDKGELVRTGIYDDMGNTQVLHGTYTITENGTISGSMKISSRGLQYDNKYYLAGLSAEKLVKHYKSGFSDINNLKLNRTSLKNNKDNQEFIEDIALEAEGYCAKTGNRIIFVANAFNKSLQVPQRYRSRKNPVVIERGFADTDEVAIGLPEGYTIEAKPDAYIIKEKFGEYKAEYISDGANRLLYKRTFVLNHGEYASSDYEGYRQFREKVALYDSAKIVLVKN